MDKGMEYFMPEVRNPFQTTEARQEFDRIADKLDNEELKFITEYMADFLLFQAKVHGS